MVINLTIRLSKQDASTMAYNSIKVNTISYKGMGVANKNNS